MCRSENEVIQSPARAPHQSLIYLPCIPKGSVKTEPLKDLKWRDLIGVGQVKHRFTLEDFLFEFHWSVWNFRSVSLVVGDIVEYMMKYVAPCQSN